MKDTGIACCWLLMNDRWCAARDRVEAEVLGRDPLPVPATPAHIPLCPRGHRPVPRKAVACVLGLVLVKQRVAYVVTDAWLAAAGGQGRQVLEASSPTFSASHPVIPFASAGAYVLVTPWPVVGSLAFTRSTTRFIYVGNLWSTQ